MTSIELLSPAQNLECGIAAIDHGADAVYIGSPHFGARAAAGNSIEDIQSLCQYAHPFGVKIYVTFNTILYDNELDEACRLVWDLYHAGVDALIIQDFSLLKMDLPPIHLHASTQMDNRTPEKIQWLQDLGFQQTVLARELSIEQIRSIHQSVPQMPLEAFVHGALCVSYSGQCWASQYCFGRSGNRGECAQFCRLPFKLTDATGKALSPECHLLSLRDMCRVDSLEEMMDAGIRSFKIEGRLKDVSYVKNVTAAYRLAIDRILKHRSDEYCRSSLGHSEFNFTPDLQRSFSRGFTNYFLHGRQGSVASMDTPKSRGTEVGRVKEVYADCIVVSGTTTFANGDGLCYMSSDGKLRGFRINRAEGNRLYPSSMPQVQNGDLLWRNFDQAWERKMSSTTAIRSINIKMRFTDTPQGFRLSVKREDGAEQSFDYACEHQLAHSQQDKGICQTLAKTGDTVYTCTDVEVELSQPWFVPRSLLSKWRRDALTAAFDMRKDLSDSSPTQDLSQQEVEETSNQPVSDSRTSISDATTMPKKTLNYQANVSNHLAKQFLEQHGFHVDEMAMECRQKKDRKTLLMTCRHCLRYEFGWCRKHGDNPQQMTEPLYLNLNDGRQFRLEFDCQHCEMKIWNA